MKVHDLYVLSLFGLWVGMDLSCSAAARWCYALGHDTWYLRGTYMHALCQSCPILQPIKCGSRHVTAHSTCRCCCCCCRITMGLYLQRLVTTAWSTFLHILRLNALGHQIENPTVSCQSLYLTSCQYCSTHTSKAGWQ